VKEDLPLVPETVVSVKDAQALVLRDLITEGGSDGF
jgi:hypothetical protein